MERVSCFLSRKAFHEVEASDGKRSWLWCYWPARVELLASCYNRGLPPVALREALSVDRRHRVAERVKLGEAGLPDLEPLADGGEWATRFPKLTAYLVDSTFTDGSPRQCGKLFIAVDKGKWVACLKEPNQGIMLEVVVDQPQHALTALEAALANPKPPWRHDPWARKQGQKKTR